MHQTTVRFGSDLWEALEAECARLGVSAAQYLREAALARLAYTAGRRGDPLYDEALVAVGAPQTQGNGAADREVAAMGAEGASSDSHERVAESSAVNAQSEQVRARARVIRERAEELRRQTTRWRNS